MAAERTGSSLGTFPLRKAARAVARSERDKRLMDSRKESGCRKRSPAARKKPIEAQSPPTRAAPNADELRPAADAPKNAPMAAPTATPRAKRGRCTSDRPSGRTTLSVRSPMLSELRVRAVRRANRYAPLCSGIGRKRVVHSARCGTLAAAGISRTRTGLTPPTRRTWA
jgi:hypothetical protein